jgi:hypothetical protein
MSCYSIPALTMENEFVNLTWLSRYVDDLVKRTGDNDYAIVYEWDEDGPGDWPPVAVLARLDGRWWRRPVLVTSKQAEGRPRKYDLELGEPQAVNGH